MEENTLYRVTPVIKDEDNLEIVTERNDFNNIMSEVSRTVLNLQDQAIREGLIKLGWTPPKV